MSDFNDRGGGSSAMDLLQQYNDHREVKNKIIQDIERNTVITDSHDIEKKIDNNESLLLEINLLNKIINEKDLEIENLHKTIEELKSRGSVSNLSVVQEVLPPPEAPPVPPTIIGRSSSMIKNGPNLNSPAASVTYTTSRITIASPNKKSTMSQGVSLDMDEELLPDQFLNKSLESTLKNPMDNTIDFSPSSKQELNSFAHLVDSSFEKNNGLDRNELKQARNISIAESFNKVPPVKPFNIGSYSSPISLQDLNSKPEYVHSTSLGSPILINTLNEKRRSNVGSPIDEKLSLRSSSTSSSAKLDNQTNIISKSSMSSCNASKSMNPPINCMANATSNMRVRRPPLENNSSSNNNIQVRSDIPLFVQPNEFNTINIDIVSTLYSREDISNLILFKVIDKNSEKLMFKFSKAINKIYELDALLKSNISLFDLQVLPILPDKQLFQICIPTKVDERREKLSDYFATLFTLPNLSSNIILKILQFISTDTIIVPSIPDDDILKEGPLLLRRSKTLGSGQNWKLRYGVLKNDSLFLYDEKEKQLLETIKMKQATIELLPNLPDNKFGTKNGFVVNEHKKSGLSSSIKYFFCTEKAKERESWVSIISEVLLGSMSLTSFNMPVNHMHNTSNIQSSSYFSKNSDANTTEHTYVTDLTLEAMSSPNSQHTSGTNSNSSASHMEPSPQNDNLEKGKNKMRSLFPFKILSSTNSANTIDTNTTSNVSASLSDEHEVKYSDSSIKKSLEALNIGSKEAPQYSLNNNFIFGATLEESLKLSSHVYQGIHELPSVMYRCLEYLYKNHGLQEEGVFRLSGSSALIKSLQEQFNREYDVDLCEYNQKVSSGANANSNLNYQDVDEFSSNKRNGYIDINTVTGLLKLYLRKLPHLLFGDDNYSTFKTIVDNNYNNQSKIAIEFRNLIKNGTVPTANVSLMYSLFELLVRINENNKINKMNLKNLCIVFSPTLNIPINILQPFIVDFACIFKGEAPIDESKREGLDIHIPQM